MKIIPSFRYPFEYWWYYIDCMKIAPVLGKSLKPFLGIGLDLSIITIRQLFMIICYLQA